jgi:hypothetical protein
VRVDATFAVRDVRVDGRSWRVAYPIGFDLAGRRLWTAQHPTNETTDVYVNFLNRSPLSAWSFACYVCVLDPQTGRLLSAEFTK